MEKIEITQPADSELEALGIAAWSPWECEPSAFQWAYDREEWCFIFEGRAEIKPENGEAAVIKTGDLVKFPQGLRCIWRVHEKIRKVYIFK
jgi:uncharacterized protein